MFLIFTVNGYTRVASAQNFESAFEHNFFIVQTVNVNEY